MFSPTLSANHVCISGISLQLPRSVNPLDEQVQLSASRGSPLAKPRCTTEVCVPEAGSGAAAADVDLRVPQAQRGPSTDGAAAMSGARREAIF